MTEKTGVLRENNVADTVEERGRRAHSRSTRTRGSTHAYANEDFYNNYVSDIHKNEDILKSFFSKLVFLKKIITQKRINQEYINDVCAAESVICNLIAIVQNNDLR